jgi:hypothetical protein
MDSFPFDFDLPQLSPETQYLLLQDQNPLFEFDLQDEDLSALDFDVIAAGDDASTTRFSALSTDPSQAEAPLLLVNQLAPGRIAEHETTLMTTLNDSSLVGTRNNGSSAQRPIAPFGPCPPTTRDASQLAPRWYSLILTCD